VLDGLAEEELTKFNAGKRRQDQVADPCRPIIGAFNNYLQWYSMYRSRTLQDTQVQDMDEKGEALLETLQRVFPHFVITTRKDGTVVRRSKWCTEKTHSIKHGGSNYRSAGRCRNYTVQALETQHKFAVKAVAPNTNNQAAVGESILLSNIRRESSESQALASQIDRTGMWRACRSWCTLLVNFSFPLCPLCTLYAYCAYFLPPMYTLCTHCAYCASIYTQYTLFRTGSLIVYTRCKKTHKV